MKPFICFTFAFCCGYFGGVVLTYFRPESPTISYCLLGAGIGIILSIINVPGRFFKDKD